jgi:histone-lysine N-methyltransferase SETMAR
MDMKSICLFLAHKHETAKDVCDEINEVLGAHTIGYSTITQHLRLARFDDVPTDTEEIKVPSLVDDAILTALERAPFSSIRELARATCLPITTVHRHLIMSLGFTVKHLRWVPHSLTASQKHQRVQLSKELLLLLTSVQADPNQYLITLDESWFYLWSERDTIWLQPGSEPPERVKHTVQDEKVMITIAWWTSGFHLVTGLPKGQKFNANYYINQILTPLLNSELYPPDTKLIIHADNARPHMAKKCQDFLEEIGADRAPHPPYSPDLAPSDFFLFGHLKGCLKGTKFQDSQELLSFIQ